MGTLVGTSHLVPPTKTKKKKERLVELKKYLYDIYRPSFDMMSNYREMQETAKELGIKMKRGDTKIDLLQAIDRKNVELWNEARKLADELGEPI